MTVASVLQNRVQIAWDYMSPACHTIAIVKFEDVDAYVISDGRFCE